MKASSRVRDASFVSPRGASARARCTCAVRSGGESAHREGVPLALMESRALVPYDHPRLLRISRIMRDVNVPPNTAVAPRAAHVIRIRACVPSEPMRICVLCVRLVDEEEAPACGCAGSATDSRRAAPLRNERTSDAPNVFASSSVIAPNPTPHRIGRSDARRWRARRPSELLDAPRCDCGGPRVRMTSEERASNGGPPTRDRCRVRRSSWDGLARNGGAPLVEVGSQDLSDELAEGSGCAGSQRVKAHRRRRHRSRAHREAIDRALDFGGRIPCSRVGASGGERAARLAFGSARRPLRKDNDRDERNDRRALDEANAPPGSSTFVPTRRCSAARRLLVSSSSWRVFGSLSRLTGVLLQSPGSRG